MTDALQFDDVQKRYRGFTLGPITFAVPRGYIMGLIGPNGAGKTTLIKLALNLIRRDGGAVRIFGLDATSHERDIRSRVGFVPDEPHLYDDIALKHLKAATAPFYPRWSDALFNELAGSFELPLDKKFKKVSHGTKTKFSLALALAQRPDLLILDEPTAGLDPVFRSELLDTLSGLLQDEQVSVLFSTHITADLERIADYITFIQNGQLVFSSSKDDILDSFVVVRGAREVLDDRTLALFDGVRHGTHGFEGLTRHADEVLRRFGDDVATERATLDDVMVLMERKLDHAA